MPISKKPRSKAAHTPVWRVSKSEAAVLAYPEVQKFEALIERAKSGGCFCEAVEVEVQGRSTILHFRQFGGLSSTFSYVASQL